MGSGHFTSSIIHFHSKTLTEVVSGRQKTTGHAAWSPPLKLQNSFDALSQPGECAAGSGVIKTPTSGVSVPSKLALRGVEPDPRSSSRASSTSACQKLLRDAVRRHSRSHRCPAREASSVGYYHLSSSGLCVTCISFCWCTVHSLSSRWAACFSTAVDGHMS